MNAADEYKATVKRARAADSIEDELAIWREFVEKPALQPDAQSLRDAALKRIEALKAMERP